MTETDLRLDDGRTLHAYDTAADGADARLAVFWQHGTPNTGAPPEPLFPAAAQLGVRWVSHDRPGYGGSTPNPGRTVAAAAAEVASIADALGIQQFAVMGHSGGGAYALACGALLPARVLGVVCVSGLAPGPRRAGLSCARTRSWTPTLIRASTFGRDAGQAGFRGSGG